MSLYFGYQKQEIGIGGEMTQDINMQDNHILTSVDPTEEKHLERKKYVDDQDTKQLSTTGGTMTGNLNMGSNKVISSATPSSDNDLTKKIICG